MNIEFSAGDIEFFLSILVSEEARTRLENVNHRRYGRTELEKVTATEIERISALRSALESLGGPDPSPKAPDKSPVSSTATVPGERPSPGAVSIDAFNQFGVAVSGRNKVSILMPPFAHRELSKHEAFLLAAWLMVMADILPGTEAFDDYVQAVRRS